MKLNEQKIRNAKPSDSLYRIGDGDGLWLEVTPNNTKLWRARFTWNGRRSMISLGRYPTISLARAREKAHETRELAKEGRNPSRERRERRDANIRASINTFRAVAASAIKAEKEWGPGYARKVRVTLEAHAYPVIGDLRIADVNTQDVLAILEKVAERSPVTARKLRNFMSVVFKRGIVTGACITDPTVALKGVIKKPPTVSKHPVNIAEYLKTARAHPRRIVGDAMELLLLLACRPGELRQMKWEHIDLKEKLWTVPAASMKGRRDHVFPLSLAAIKILKRLGPQESGYVFTGSIPGRPFGDAQMRAALGGSVHAVRATFSTWAYSTGAADPHVVEFALAHVTKNQVSASYNKSLYLVQRRKLMDVWSKEVSARS